MSNENGRTAANATPRFGYHGRYLRVDLSSDIQQYCPIPAAAYRDFLGGTGLGVYLMLTEDQAQVDPLSPESCIALVFSPLVGSPLTTSAKFAVVCKSPLTNRYNDSLVSSGFAIAAKAAGVDAIVVAGKAPRPSVIVVDEGQVHVEPADDLWGATTSETQAALRQQLGTGYRTATIGPAGERLVRFATISHDGRHAGRGGTGAVLGSKNIKAIAVRGNQRCQWADPEGLYKYAKRLSHRSMGPATAKYRELGTAANLLTFNRLNALPTRNFQQGSFEGAERIAVETMVQSRSKTRTSCAACTVGCEHIYQIKSTANRGQENAVRVEYESLFALGSLCGVDDPDIVLEASRLCDELGMDTISAGGTIAFAMECSQHGVIDEPWLRFGSGNGVLKALNLIGRRQGFGDEMAEGTRLLSHRLGPMTTAYAAHVKGLEIPGYEPRAAHAMALGFAVGARGADHNRSGAYEADFSDQVDRRCGDQRSVIAAVETEDRAALIDSLILCKFLRGVFSDLYAEAAQMLTMTCGWDVTTKELRKTSRRIVAAKKLFNIRAGWQPDEDCLPKRFMESAIPDDPRARLETTSFHELIRRYNQARNWTAEGWIPDAELQELQLSKWFGADCKTSAAQAKSMTKAE